MRILGLGDCCVDYYIHKKMAFPGGNAFNVAVYAAENGAEAGFLGTVGDDAIGEHILKCAREKHVDISHCPVKHGVSGRAAVNIVDGDRVFVSGYFVTNSCPPFPLVISTCAPPYPCTFLAKLIHSSSDISSQENSAISTIGLTCFRYSSVRYLSSDEKSKLIIGPNARTLSI